MAALGCLETAARMAPNSTPIQVSFAHEALAQHKYDLVHEVIEKAYPRAATAESRLQLLEIRFLLALVSNRWISLVPLLSELGHLLSEHPNALPLGEDSRVHGQTILHLGLAREATRIHSALLDLFDGAIQFSDFEELVARVMRSMLPVKPPPKPATPPPVEPPKEVEVPPAPAVEPLPAVEISAAPEIEEPLPIEEPITPETELEPPVVEEPLETESSSEPEALSIMETSEVTETSELPNTVEPTVTSTEMETTTQPSVQSQPHKQRKRDRHPHRKDHEPN